MIRVHIFGLSYEQHDINYLSDLLRKSKNQAILSDIYFGKKKSIFLINK